ncbi:MAG: GNAT family N-acetyltransferase [Roseiflexaceae bacterium]|nr:GNAT family N-acetyltransferase [Roseiflexaceae bacterium]
MTEPFRFTLRPASFDDLPQLVELFNRDSQANAGEAEFTVAGYAVEWRLAGFSLADDTRVAVLPDGSLAGLIERWNFAPYVLNWLWARVEPELRGQGLGSALMAWAEQRAHASLALAPDGVMIVAECGCQASDAATKQLFLDRGFENSRVSLTMERSLDDAISEPVLPPNMSIRPMQPGQERAVYAADQEAFRDHRGFVEQPFEQGFQRMQAANAGSPHFDPALWFLAMDGAEIAGMALCAPRTDDFPAAWVNTLAVRRPWRKQGLGLALLHHSFRELQARGHHRVGLSVDSQSLTGATRLYGRAGMHATREFLIFEKVLRHGRDLSTQALEEE